MGVNIMAVKIIQKTEINSAFTLLNDSMKSLSLEIDNGDLAKLNEVMEKWNFKDYQSFLRFVISIMLVTEDKFLSIKVRDEITAIKPSAEYVKGE